MGLSLLVDDRSFRLWSGLPPMVRLALGRFGVRRGYHLAAAGVTCDAKFHLFSGGLALSRAGVQE
jgi:hypothetical protein